MIDLLVDSLACYRLTRLATVDTITDPARDFVEARSVEVEWTDDGVTDVQPWAFVRDLLDCHWCTGIWMAGILWLVPRRVRRALAVAAVAGLVADRVER